MNPILQLKGRMQSRKNPNRPMGVSFPNGKVLSVSHVESLVGQLREVLAFWEREKTIGGALVSVHYNQIVAKSNRISAMFCGRGLSSQDSVRGVCFDRDLPDSENSHHHVFTHYVPIEVLKNTIEEMAKVSEILSKKCKGHVDEMGFDLIKQSMPSDRDGFTKNRLLAYIRDAVYVDHVGIDSKTIPAEQDSIVSIFRTNIETKKLLSQFGISIFDDRILDGTTLRLRPDEIQKLRDKAPYLISMQLTDLRKLSDEDGLARQTEDDAELLIPHPGNEPFVGVIDTQFDESVYFGEWVSYVNMLSPDIAIMPKDKWHGTAVSSIIVDGPRGNPRLDDGCGRFRVRHFGVATDGGFSSFEIVKMIRRIVMENRDIHVWNLSLGSALQINDNFISPEGAILDDIQREFDVVFVVAGTNVPKGSNDSQMKIGAPADSLNSIVVNSVSFEDKPASYSRQGPVLSFFNKPDVCYYGGDGNRIEDSIVVCRGVGASYVVGTSYAAPWVARKMAYLIDVMGYRREVAKALLIDSAARWDAPHDMPLMGYGIVPVSINDIVKSKDDEIRFVLTGVADEYETYTYELPVPLVDGAYPYHARVTLSYFPYCDRSQGVDYTGTEMDVHFGRVAVGDSRSTIHSISGNKQGDEGLQVLHEADARRMYRKWDNLKHTVEKVSSRSKPRKVLGPSKLWGLSIKTKERKQDGSRDKIPFGVVVTIREMNGVNRFDTFVQMCQAYGWIVNTIDVETQVDIYTKAEEEIVLE